MKKKQTGFTIVELLIAIVVIGVLAAITIVSFNGVQVRAENQKTLVAVKSWVGILKSYKTLNDRFPTYDASTDSYAQFPCLGQGYPATKCMSLNNINTVGAGVAYERPEFISKVQSLTNTIPTPSFQQVIFSNEPMVGAFVNLGGNGSTVSIGYVLKGADTQCADVGTGTKTERARSSSGVYCGVENIQ
jgi:prepilin-type N-terminal cleavage/methylation domain-containing protein